MLNQDRLLRLPDVLKVVPVSKSSWWAGVKEGRFPAPIKLGLRTTAWRESDVLKVVAEGFSRQGQQPPVKH